MHAGRGCLFASSRRRDASAVHTNLTHLAPVALVNAALQELGAMQTYDGRIEGGNDKLVVSVATAGWLKRIPENKTTQVR